MKQLKFDINYNLDNAIFLAKLSDEIYTHTQTGINIEAIFKSKFNFDDVIFESISSVVNYVKVNLQFCILKNDKNIVIVFKGSKELDDWSTNLKTTKAKLLGTDVHVHSGFEASLELFIDIFKTSSKEIDSISLNNLYKDLTSNPAKYNLFITGHSLGGAIATLFTAHIENISDTKKVVCYTYGAPPVGFKNFYTKFKDINVFRIVNKLDPIPNINRLSRGIYLKFSPSAYMLKFLKHVGQLIELPSDEYEHHSCSHYINNLKKEGKKTLKRNPLIDIKKSVLKYRWITFLVVLVIFTLLFGFIGYGKLGYSTLDAWYLSFDLLTLDAEVKKDLNWQLEVSRFSALIFVSAAILRGTFCFLDNTVFKPIRLSKKVNHTVIFGFNGHVQELVENINKESINTKVIIVSAKEIDIANIGLKAEVVSLPEHLSRSFMGMLALSNAKEIICMDMNDNLDLTNANGVIEYLDTEDNVEKVKLYIHLHSYTLADLFNHENYMALFGKTPCNIKIFNHYDNAVRVLFRTIAMEEFLNKKTIHWLISGEWNQSIAFMRYVAQISYYSDESLPEITFVVEKEEEAKKEIKKSFPKIDKTVRINVISDLKTIVEDVVTHVAVLFENDIKGLEEAILLTNTFKKQPVFLQQRNESIITNDQIISFGLFSILNQTKIIMDEVLDERAINIHNYYKDLYGGDSWEELSLFKKNSNRMQAEHISVKLRGIGWSDEDDLNGYEEFLINNQELIQKWARVEHLRWNAFHYVNGWDYAKIRDDAKKLHHCLVPFYQLTRIDQLKDEPALLEIPKFI